MQRTFEIVNNETGDRETLDSSDILEALEEALEKAGYRVEEITDIERV